MPSFVTTAFVGLLAASSALAHPRRAHIHRRHLNLNTTSDDVTLQTLAGTGVTSLTTSTSTTTSLVVVTATLPHSSSASASAATSSVTGEPTRPSPQNIAPAALHSNSQCTPGTVYVTEVERVTVTVGTSSSADAPLFVTVTPSPVSVSEVKTDTATVAQTTASAAQAPAVEPPTPSDSSSVSVHLASTTELPTGGVVQKAVVAPSPVEFSVSVATVATVTASEPVSSSSSSPTSSPSAPVHVVSASNKRGIAYNIPELANHFQGSSVSWAYNWGQLPNIYNGVQMSPSLDSSIEFIPLLWGDLPVHTRSWAMNAEMMISAGAPALLGFNEPDHQGQAYMDVSTCAAKFKQYLTPFAGRVRLGSPAVTNGSKNGAGGVMGLEYLKQFLSQCTDCGVDFAVIHWYDSATNIEYFKSHVEKAHKETGLPVWLTEFRATGSDEEVATFLAEALPWLDSQDYVERYSYFMASDGIMISSGTLNAVGKAYIGA